MKFKRLFAVSAALFAFASSLYAFDGKTFWREYGGGLKNGDSLINAGVGLTNRLFNLSESFYVIPPVSLGYERMVHINETLPFSFGAMVFVSGNGARTDAGAAYNNAFFEIPVTVKYHFNFGVDSLDVYAGNVAGFALAVLGNQVFAYPVLGGFVGASWFFSENSGLSVDMGYPYIVSVSISFRF